MLRLLIAFLAVQPCLAAVTWRTIGCDGWTFQGSTAAQIWDNAADMVVQAQSQIAAVPNGPSMSKPKRIAGANAKFMWGIDYHSATGTNSDGRTALGKANSKSRFRSSLSFVGRAASR